jgi:hypothetical protein
VQLAGFDRQPGDHRVHPVIEQRRACLVPVQVQSAHVGVRMLVAQLA